ncbi:MAG: isopentenyl-diphosphate Delta-isomerase, partial [Actinomycetes bacterium]
MAGDQRAEERAGDDELVVLLDASGRPAGTARKGDVHHAPAPYHLAFSCYAFGPDGRLLVTRRAASKRTWPGVWTNTCCGHPAPGEEPQIAVRRRLADELGTEVIDLVLALPDFSYRVRDGDVEEHELCPVYLARVGRAVAPHPDEVDETGWWPWEDFLARASDDPALSPWARLQAPLLADAVSA